MVFQGPDYLSIFTKKKSKSYRILNFTFQPEIAQQAGEPMGVKGKVASVIGLWTDSQAHIFLCVNTPAGGMGTSLLSLG